MSDSTEQRKLAAIMFTDMVGYSALSQRNEALALELLEEHRRVVRGLLPRHNGREVKTTGDGFLLEFPSALAAVQGAVEIQNALHERNQVSAPDRQLRIRIGIHVGDVVMRDGDIHGDGVNIAARIEPLAPSGGICVSNAVFEQVRNKLEQGFASLGPAELKNIEMPVAVHRVVMPWEKGPARLPSSAGNRNASWLRLAVPLLVAAIVVTVMVWRPWRMAESKSPTPAGRQTPLTEAQKLTQQARALIDDDPLLVRENYRMADELCARATSLSPDDGELWATYGRVTCRYIQQYHESSDKMIADARSRSERAIRLAPASVESGLAAAEFDLTTRSYATAEQRLQSLLERAPTDKRILTRLASAAGEQSKLEACRQWAERADALPGGAPFALNELAWLYWGLNRYPEMGPIIERSLARAPTTDAYQQKLMLLVWGWGDIETGRAFLAQIPPAVLLEDRVAYLAFITRYWSRQAEEAFELIKRVPREFIQEGRVFSPRDYLAGEALLLAGKSQAAEVKFRSALRAVEERLATSTQDHRLYFWKGRILARLGDLPAAQKEFTTGRELNSSSDTLRPWPQDLMLLGRHDEAIAVAAEGLQRDRSRWPLLYHDLKFNPAFDPLRGEARFQELTARAQTWMDELRGRAPSSAAAGAALANDKSVAVLAFANLSEDKANEYFSDGISEELLNVLAKVPGLKVTARTSSFHFKGKDTPIPEIARQLGVAFVVEGSVRKAGDKVRITAQLIKAADGFHVWSDTFTRDLKDVFAVQDEIAGLIAQNLSLKLGAASPRAAIHPEAFRRYLEGRKEWSLRTEAALAKAEKFFTQAIGLDPKFARAHAGLADVWMIRADVRERENQNADVEYVHASEALDRALQLDPELAEAYATRGNYFNHKEQYAEAEQAFKRAIALNPNYASAHQWYGRLLFTLGKLDAGLAELELATRLDPLSPIITSNYGMFLGFARRWSESLAACDRVLAMQPDFAQALGVRAWALIHLDRKPEALAIVQAALESPADSPAATNQTTYMLTLLALAGDRANAERLAAPILAGASRNSPEDVFALFLVFNRTDEAFTYLEQSKYRFKQSDVVKLLNPIYDSVRDDPRALRKLDEAGLLAAYKDMWAQYLAWKRKSGQP